MGEHVIEPQGPFSLAASRDFAADTSAARYAPNKASVLSSANGSASGSRSRFIGSATTRSW